MRPIYIYLLTVVVDKEIRGISRRRQRIDKTIMEYCKRPNRSDVHLTEEEEAKLEETTRDYFDGIAPKRHTKPQRSEYSNQYVDDRSGSDVIPELEEFTRLENDTEKIVYKGGKVTEEFTETEYYKDLSCVDKQHHTTGTGFIKVENADDKSFKIVPESDVDHHASCKGNPATNDWIPATADMASFHSDKPKRSES